MNANAHRSNRTLTFVDYGCNGSSVCALATAAQPDDF